MIRTPEHGAPTRASRFWRPYLPEPVVRRRWVRRAVVRLGAVAFCYGVAACGAGNAASEEVPKVYISLGGWGSEEHVSPLSVVIDSDVTVEFRVADWRVHTVRFVIEEMELAQASFLERGGLVMSPLLVERGDQFVVAMAGAPPGRYPFIVEGFGAPVRGAILVDPRITP